MSFISKTFFLEFLSEAIYISVDPYMRAYTDRMKLGSILVGTQVGR